MFVGDSLGRGVSGMSLHCSNNRDALAGALEACLRVVFGLLQVGNETAGLWFPCLASVPAAGGISSASEKEVDRHGTSVQLGNGCCFLQIPLFYLGDCLMKKSLIALAALGAFAGAASAQSSVTLYGTLDVGVAKATGLDLTAHGVSGSSFHTPSRFGIKGTEDLGNGMSAIFDLQTGGFGMGDGKSGNAGGGLSFGREAYVGLSGGFGTVKAGLDASVATYGFAGINLNGISSSDAADSVGIQPVTWYSSSRRPGFVSYTTPNMAGLDVAIGYTLKGTMEDVLAAYDKASTQARVNYVAGPLTVAVVAETKRSATSRTAYAVGGKYDAGMVVATLGYVVSTSEAIGKGITGGVAGKFGAATAGVQLAKNSETEDTGVELFANYALSKRTTLYADFLSNKKDAADTTVKKLGVGVQHNF